MKKLCYGWIFHLHHHCGGDDDLQTDQPTYKTLLLILSSKFCMKCECLVFMCVCAVGEWIEWMRVAFILLMMMVKCMANSICFFRLVFYGSKLLSWIRTISERSRVLFSWKKLLLFYWKIQPKKSKCCCYEKWMPGFYFLFNRRSLVFLFLIEKRMFEEMKKNFQKR